MNNASLFALCAVVAFAAAAPAPPPAAAAPPAPPAPSSPSSPSAQRAAEPVAILSQLSEVNPDGSYVNKFETANGITVSEEGSTKVQDKDVIQVAKGSSSYSAPDGTLIETQWYADDTGFHATGPHIPVAPETPAYILKSLEWSAAHPEEEKVELAKSTV